MELIGWCCGEDPERQTALREWGRRVIASQLEFRREYFDGLDARAELAVDDLHSPSDAGRARYAAMWKDRDRAVAACLDREMQSLTEILLGDARDDDRARREAEYSEFVAWVRLLREVNAMPNCVVMPRAKPDIIRIFWGLSGQLRFADADGPATAKRIVIDAAPRLLELRRSAIAGRMHASAKGSRLAQLDEVEFLHQASASTRPALAAEVSLAELQGELLIAIEATLTPESTALLRSEFLSAAYGDLGRPLFETAELRDALSRFLSSEERVLADQILKEDSTCREKSLLAFLSELDRTITDVNRAMVRDEKSRLAALAAMARWEDASQRSALSAVRAIVSLIHPASEESRKEVGAMVERWQRDAEMDASLRRHSWVLSAVGANE
ncbi:MAG: hypothetical protein U0572_07660 [Phycisphaerales bacterium]